MAVSRWTAILCSAVAILAAILACAKAPDYQLRGWTATPPVSTPTVLPTQTPRYVQVEVTARPSATPSPTPPQPYPATIRGAWNCHAAPSITSPTTAYLADGQRVTVIARAGAWLQIKTDRAVCFVNAASVP